MDCLGEKFRPCPIVSAVPKKGHRLCSFPSSSVNLIALCASLVKPTVATLPPAEIED